MCILFVFSYLKIYLPLIASGRNVGVVTLLLHVTTVLNSNCTFCKYSLTFFCFSEYSCSKLAVWGRENIVVGHGEQEECRHSCNVMLLKTEMELHSYFAGFAQITWKIPHKAMFLMPLMQFRVTWVTCTSCLYVQSKYSNVNNIKYIYVC